MSRGLIICAIIVCTMALSACGADKEYQTRRKYLYDVYLMTSGKMLGNFSFNYDVGDGKNLFLQAVDAREPYVDLLSGKTADLSGFTVRPFVLRRGERTYFISVISGSRFSFSCVSFNDGEDVARYIYDLPDGSDTALIHSLTSGDMEEFKDHFDVVINDGWTR